MSTTEPKLSRRDKMQAELSGCVDDHEKIRGLLKRIDTQAPGLMPLTGEIRNFLLDLGQRYNLMRTEMAVSVMVADGEFDAPSACGGQRPVNELELFQGVPAVPMLPTHPIRDESAAFARELARASDDTLKDDLSDLADRNAGEMGRRAA